MVHAVRTRIPHRQLPTVRASVLTAKTSTESMSSSTSSSSKRAIAADAAKKGRAAVFAWNADPASVAYVVSDAASAILMGGGGFESRVSADRTLVQGVPEGAPLIDRVMMHLQSIDGLRVSRPLKTGACGSLEPQYNFIQASVCSCTDATASPGGSQVCAECGSRPYDHGAGGRVGLAAASRRQRGAKA